MFIRSRLCNSAQLCYLGSMSKPRFLALCIAVIGTFAMGLPALAPPAGERVFFRNGNELQITWHAVERNEVVLTLRDGRKLVADARFIDKIEPDATRPVPVKPHVISSATSEKPYAELIERASALHGVDPSLVYALIQVESGYQADAESPRGAMGLMQLMPGTALRYNVGNPFDPASNIDAGTRHLRTLLDEFGTRGALAAYNAGEGPVRQFDGIPPYSETRKYVSRILDIAERQVQIQ